MQRPTTLRPRVIVADKSSLETTPARVRAAVQQMGDGAERSWTDDGVEWCVASIGPSSWPLFVVTSFVRESSSPPSRRLTNSPFPMWTFDRATFRFVFVNEAAASLYGDDVGRLVGKRVVEFQAWADAFEHVRAVADLPEDGVSQMRLRIRRGDGTTATVDAQLLATQYDGRPACSVLTGQTRDEVR